MTTPTQMATEIAEQPEALARTLDALRPLRIELAALARDARLVLFYARGSSDNAANYGRYLLEVHARRPAAMGAPSVATHYRSSLDLCGVLAVAVSQSGETEEIVETARWARDRGAKVVGVTNVADAALSRVADITLVTRAGAERAVPATKTYTAQLAAMAVLGSALGPEDRDFENALARTPEEVARMLQSAPDAESMADRLGEVQRLVVSGRGLVLGSAQELALKLGETCYITTTGLSFADLQHGPIAVLDAATPALLMAAQDGPMLPGMTELARAVAGRGSTPLGIGGDRDFQSACAAALPGPALPEALAPLALIVPGQLLTEALARRRGLDPDRPRTLSKVTQTSG
ncbi:MAG: glutamine--fructose-6-phosphate aminotransferase [Candidatus Nephthysia bennettiae]|uniref:SIS domain-containing protein n=1 Tax=Candidatus Nephthysia bennettiae TaxID=3127016 RepID=A0A934K195_9BACT|nr:SIS domain-containing protein [Candidatus Dormibacteraeota bacterium]MBJ7614328.1 SIS domain-containing protein [Candidatus Dormibacteraeota bacterium]PZR99862.1 MAG: glutamine--fructose-6-phosphate aminotransferase [Candidatus Dormibacteraeota bacterium]